MKGYKIISPIRFFIFILLCVTIILFAGYAVITSGSTEAAVSDTYREITVHENDTLWSIAEDISNNGDDNCNMDCRDIIQKICETNDIKPGDIKKGDIIFVPII